MDEKKHDDIKKEIRSVLLTYQGSVTLDEFLETYRNLVGQQLPSRGLGFSSDVAFLKSMPDVVDLQSDSHGKVFLSGIADKTSQHIQKLVSKQRKAKSTSNKCKPLRIRHPAKQRKKGTGEKMKSLSGMNNDTPEISTDNLSNISRITCAFQDPKETRATNKVAQKRKYTDAKKNTDIKRNAVKEKQADLVAETLDYVLQNYGLENKSRVFAALLQIYVKYKSQLLDLEMAVQNVWKKISDEMLEKHSLNFDELQCRTTIKQLQCDYERNMNESVSREVIDFLISAKNAFETVKDPDTHITSDGAHLMKMQNSPTAQTSSENSPKIPRITCCSQNPEENEGIRKRKHSMVEENMNIKEVPVKAKQANLTKETLDDLLQNYKLEEKSKVFLLLLEIYAKYKTELVPEAQEQDVWKKIAKEMQEKCSLNCDEIQCCNTIKQLQCNYEKNKSKSPVNQETMNFINAAKNAFEANKDPANLTKETLDDLLQNYKLEEKSKVFLLLLEIYTKYKTELVPEAQEQDVWKKIAKEMQEKCSLNCDEIQCCNTIKQLQCNYEKNKSKSPVNQETMDFINAAKNAFEANKDPDFKRLADKTQERKTEFEKRLTVLKIYNMYKEQFSSPDVNEKSVWEEIAKKVKMENSLKKKTPSYALHCIKQIASIKCEYEEIKKSTVISSGMHIFLDEMMKAFENTECPDFERLAREMQGKENFERRLVALKAYNMYKRLFSSPNVSEESVWQEIVKKIRTEAPLRSASYCVFNCIEQIASIKREYEKMKKSKVIPPGMHIFWEEGMQAFENTKYPATLISRISELSRLEEKKQERRKKNSEKFLADLKSLKNFHTTF